MVGREGRAVDHSDGGGLGVSLRKVVCGACTEYAGADDEDVVLDVCHDGLEDYSPDSLEQHSHLWKNAGRHGEVGFRAAQLRGDVRSSLKRPRKMG